ncbi:MAG: HAD-IA family hydrolase [Actinomycetota bacterium]
MGEVGLVEARRELVALAAEKGLDLDPLSLMARLARHDDQREEVVERTRKIRRSGIRSALVTNNVLEFGDAWRSMIPVDELFELVVDSCQTGVRKPDPAMYRQALAALDVEPEQAAFLDDFPANVTAAEAIGMHGIVVDDDRLAAFDRLEALLWPS